MSFSRSKFKVTVSRDIRSLFFALGLPIRATYKQTKTISRFLTFREAIRLPSLNFALTLR